MSSTPFPDIVGDYVDLDDKGIFTVGRCRNGALHVVDGPRIRGKQEVPVDPITAAVPALRDFLDGEITSFLRVRDLLRDVFKGKKSDRGNVARKRAEGKLRQLLNAYYPRGNAAKGKLLKRWEGPAIPLTLSEICVVVVRGIVMKTGVLPTKKDVKEAAIAEHRVEPKTSANKWTQAFSTAGLDGLESYKPKRRKKRICYRSGEIARTLDY